jgi:hypothetical protein
MNFAFRPNRKQNKFPTKLSAKPSANNPANSFANQYLCCGSHILSSLLFVRKVFVCRVTLFSRMLWVTHSNPANCSFSRLQSVASFCLRAVTPFAPIRPLAHKLSIVYRTTCRICHQFCGIFAQFFSYRGVCILDNARK